MAFKIVQIEGENMNRTDPIGRFIPELLLTQKGMRYLGALEENEILVGALAYRLEDNMIRLLWVDVDEGFRRMGAGSALVDALTGFLATVPEGYPLLAYYTVQEEHLSLTRLLRSRGNFMLTSKPVVYRIRAEEKERSRLYKRLLQTRSRAERFYELPKSEQSIFLKRIREKGIIDLNPVEDEISYDKDLCYCQRMGGNIAAAVFVKHGMDTDGESVITFMYGSSGSGLLDALSATVQGADKKYHNGDLTFTALHEGSKILVDGLFGEDYEKGKLVIAEWTGLEPGAGSK